MAFHRPLQKYSVSSPTSLAKENLRFDVSDSDPCLYSVFGGGGGAAGAIATHIDDIQGCGEADITSRTRDFSEMRRGELEVLGKSFAHVGMELGRKDSYPVTLTQENFAKNLRLIRASPKLWAARQKQSSPARPVLDG